MSKLRNPLGSVDSKILAVVGDGDVTAAQLRAAHQQVFGTEAGASACIVRFDRAGRLRTASGELGSRGRLAAGLAAAPRAERAQKVERDIVTEEMTRLRRRFPNASEAKLRELAESHAAQKEYEQTEREKLAELERASRPARAPTDPLRKTDPRVREVLDMIGEKVNRADLRRIHEDVFGPRPTEDGAAQDAWDKTYEQCVPRIKRADLLAPTVRQPREERAPREPGAPRAPRAPTDPLRKTDPRVRAMLESATAEGPIDRAGVRLIHEAIFGPRPEEDGAAREEWDHNFEVCVPRISRAHLLIVKKRGDAAPKSACRQKGASIDKASARIMREARGELTRLRKHAMGVAKLDADASTIGRSKSEGDALRASKQAALKELDSLWATALKSGPLDAIGLLNQAADLVADKFPGNRFGYETKASGVLSAAMGAGAVAAE